MSQIKLILQFGFLMLFSGVMQAQQLQTISAASLALSGCDAGYQREADPFFNNPASLSGSQLSGIGINYINRFLIAELSSASIGGVWAGEQSALAASLHYYGSGAFNESLISLAYGQYLFPWLDAGMRLNYHHLRVEALSQFYHTVSGELGINAKISPAMNIALVYKNPTRSAFAAETSEMVPEIDLGFFIHEPTRYYAGVQLSLRDYRYVDFSLGFEYKLVEQLLLRTGLLVSDHLSYSLGLGIVLHKIRVDIGFREHLILGSTAGIALSYSL